MALTNALLRCAPAAWFRQSQRTVGPLALMTFFLVSAPSWAQPPCGAIADAFDLISQARVSSKADQEERAKLLLALRNLAEVHSRLVEVSEVKPALWICLSGEVNAFTLERDKPIFVMLGFLVRFGDDKDVLAALLAHELGHLERDHAGYRNTALGVFNYNAQLAARAEWYRTYRYDQAYRAAAYEFQRQRFAFSREQEKDADSYGTILLSRAGFRPDATVKMLARMLAIKGNRPTEWSDTHPGLLERIALVVPRVYDEESELLARSLSEKEDQTALARQINVWLQQLPDSGNAWFYKAAFLERLRSAHIVEAHERALSRDNPSISRTDEELTHVWLALCVGLFHAGYKVESANCSRRIGRSDLREAYRAATFGDMLFVGGPEQPVGQLLTATHHDGRKVITNDPSMLRFHGLPTSQTVAPWRAVRFPPSEADSPLPEQ